MGLEEGQQRPASADDDTNGLCFLCNKTKNRSSLPVTYSSVKSMQLRPIAPTLSQWMIDGS